MLRHTFEAKLFALFYAVILGHAFGPGPFPTGFFGLFSIVGHGLLQFFGSLLDDAGRRRVWTSHVEARCKFIPVRGCSLSGLQVESMFLKHANQPSKLTHLMFAAGLNQ